MKTSGDRRGARRWARQGRHRIGQTVQKFDKNGKLLMTLGTPGVNGNGRDAFQCALRCGGSQSNGDIFVSDGHGTGTNERIVKIDKGGKFIQAMGTSGSGPGAFSSLHSLAMDSRGRLFVANRDNNRVDIFDQDGKLLDSWDNSRGRAASTSIRTMSCMSAIPNRARRPRPIQDWTRGIRVEARRTGR